MKQKTSMITTRCGRHWTTRNSSHFKKVTPTIPGEAVGTDNTDDSSDDDDDNTLVQQQPAPQIAPQLPTPPAVNPAPVRDRHYPVWDCCPTSFFMDYAFNNWTAEHTAEASVGRQENFMILHTDFKSIFLSTT